MIIMGTRLGDFLSLFVRPLLTSFFFFSNPTAWIRSGGGVPLPVQPKQRPLAVRLRKRREAVSRLGPSGRRTPKKKRITAHRVYPQREEESRAELPSSPILPAFQLWLNENLKTPPPRRLYSHGDTRSKRRAMDRAAREARQSLSRGVPCMSHLTFFIQVAQLEGFMTEWDGNEGRREGEAAFMTVEVGGVVGRPSEPQSSKSPRN